MRLNKILLLGAAGSALLVTVANAADIPVVVPPPVIVAPVVVDAGFDWNGIFVGSFGGIVLTTLEPRWWNAGAQIGFNREIGSRFFVGGIAQAGAWFYGDFSDAGWEAKGYVRAGVATDRALIYGLAGIGTYDGDGPHYNFGGGVEVGLGERLSVFGQASIETWPPGIDLGYYRLEGGINFHFGN